MINLDDFITNSLMKIAAEEVSQSAQQGSQQSVNTQPMEQQQQQQQQTANPMDLIAESMGMIVQGVNTLNQILTKIGVPNLIMMGQQQQQAGITVPQAAPPQPQAQTPIQALASAPAMNQPQVQIPSQAQGTI